LILNRLNGSPPPVASARFAMPAPFTGDHHDRDAQFPAKLALAAAAANKKRRGAPGLFERTCVAPRTGADGAQSLARAIPTGVPPWRGRRQGCRGDQNRIVRRRFRRQLVSFDAAPTEAIPAWNLRFRKRDAKASVKLSRAQ